MEMLSGATPWHGPATGMQSGERFSRALPPASATGVPRQEHRSGLPARPFVMLGGGRPRQKASHCGRGRILQPRIARKRDATRLESEP